MRITTTLCILAVLGLSACQKSEQVAPLGDLDTRTLHLPESVPANPLEAPASRATIDAEALELLQRDGVVNWAEMSDAALWSAVNQTDSIVSIGYMPYGESAVDDRIHQIDLDDTEWAATRRAIIDYVVEATQRLHPDQQVDEKELLAFGEKALPYLNIRIWDYETLATLRRAEEVRYLDPMGYGTESAERSSFGCGSNGPDYSLPSSDWIDIQPGAKMSWNYPYANIEDAWDQSQGDNITIGVIDTGLSANQNKLNSQFATDWSTGRTREKYGFYEECWWWWCWNEGPNDQCGHGTSMAGTIAAPRTNDGSITGVAYKSNLISCRGTEDVVINGSREKDGVTDALYYLGSRSDLDIISMSIGDVFYSGQVADGVNYAYNNQKLIFAAAGTSLSWTSWVGVIFPANMSQCTAVTGIKTGFPMERCVECHSGSQVEFVAVMQDRTNTSRNAITIAHSGDHPSETGGSSVATATTAGIAALVWAQDPSMTRDEVKEKMKMASSNYPSPSGQFGWGIVNAAAAVDLVP